MTVEYIGGQKVVIVENLLFFLVRKGPLIETSKQFGWTSFSVNKEIIEHLIKHRLILCIINGLMRDRYYRLIPKPEEFVKQSNERGSFGTIEGVFVYRVPYNTETLATFRDSVILPEGLKLFG